MCEMLLSSSISNFLKRNVVLGQPSDRVLGIRLGLASFLALK